MRRLRFELAAMALVVVLAALSVFATVGSARGSDLVFCRLAEGDMVVGLTTDCSTAIDVDLGRGVDYPVPESSARTSITSRGVSGPQN